jgi:hypothetical protein
VIARRSGTVTWLPERGKVIPRGGKILETDEVPVTLMFGTVPAYRDLEAGVEDGTDVRQLERNLSKLGFDPYGEMTIDDEFTSATTSAVERWQEDSGYEETGTVALGDVVFMDGPRRISALNVDLGTGIGSSGSSGAAPASSSGESSQSIFASYSPTTRTIGPGPQSPEEEGETGEEPPNNGEPGGQEPEPPPGDQGKPGPGSGGTGMDPEPNPEQPRDPGIQQPSITTPAPSPSGGYQSSGASPASDAAGAESSVPSTEVMETSSDRQAVTLELDSADQDFARKGASATVDMPDGKEAEGRITSVATEATDAAATDQGVPSTEEAEPDLVVEVVIRLLGKAASQSAVEEAPVTVELKKVVAKDVLTVPVTAVGAGTGGGYTVTIVDQAGEAEAIPVEVGVFSDGFVEIEGEGLQAGMNVEVPQ